MSGKIINPADVPSDLLANREAARAELDRKIVLPPAIAHIRRAQADARDRATPVRGMSAEALEYFWGLVACQFPAQSLDAIVADIGLTEEHRRIFPELPEADGVSVWRQDGVVRFEFFRVEARRH